MTKNMHVNDVIETGEMLNKTEEDSAALKNFVIEQGNMYRKMHTPWTREFRKVGRNEICPYCGSGKKYKNCTCYGRYDNLQCE